MNKIRTKVEKIAENGGISKIEGRFGAQKLVAVALELPSHIAEGKEAFFVFKETEVGLAKNLSGEISFSNRFEGRIARVETGSMLAKISIDIEGANISSIITSDAAKRLNLASGDVVTAFVKATEVSIEEAK